VSISLSIIKKGGKLMGYQMGKCRLSYWLQERNMSPSELADALGIDRQQVNKWLKETQGMSMTSAKNVAHVLRLRNIEDLYEWIWVPSKRPGKR
jgi:DNA-binding XRE family transcriptional regulator